MIDLLQEIEIQDSNERNACEDEVLMDVSGEGCALISLVGGSNSDFECEHGLKVRLTLTFT